MKNPVEGARWNQVQGAGRPGERLKSSHHALSEALPQPIRAS